MDSEMTGAAFEYSEPEDLNAEQERLIFEPDPEDLQSPEMSYDEPDAKLIGEKKPRSVKAKRYEKKIRQQFDTAFRVTVQHPNTVPDAAAILMHAPQVAEKTGDLADADPRVARAIDFLTEGAENPYANLALAVAPLLLQVLRNHEPHAETETRGIRVPFTKRRVLTKFTVRIRLGRLRNMTNDPDALTTYVFTNPDIRASLDKQGIKVATRDGK